MPSSTSSSKYVIGIAALTFGALTLAYAYLAPIFFPAGGIPQSQFQENVARLENVLYATKSPRVVIVGSSMAARLEPVSLPSDFASLAFSGDSSRAGLSVLEQAFLAPPVVLVELNDSILREPNQELLSFAKPGIRKEALRRVPALRQIFQPYCILLAILKGVPKPIPEIDEVPADYENIISMQMKTLGNLPDESSYAPALKELKRETEVLASRGSKIFFFDLPRDPRITKGVRESRFRQVLAQYFPLPPGAWITPSFQNGYHTSDGVHLLPASANRFARELAAKTH